jgi:hypothetical protein
MVEVLTAFRACLNGGRSVWNRAKKGIERIWQ